jgi:hypothetical protein
MALWVKFTLAGLGLIIVAGLAIWLASVRWNGNTRQLVEKLTQAAPAKETKTVTFTDLDQLPAPVARYFRVALKEGQPFIRSARIAQTGQFRASEAEDGWVPFEATEYFSSRPPGFVWDASIRMAPLMDARVRDGYVAGQGAMQVKVLALVAIMDERGKAELNAGALQRYLAEAVWIPTALLPGEGVSWSAIDHNRALATLTDSGVTVSLEFRFNDAGEVTEVFTPGRYREVNGKYKLTPWAGRFWGYAERDGMRIPLEGEVEWQAPSGNLPYWKGRLVEVDFDFARY